jgi:hypothetical protein
VPPIVDSESRKAKEKREKKKEVRQPRLIFYLSRGSFFLAFFARVKLELNSRASADPL